jgi:hypothetical protein
MRPGRKIMNAINGFFKENFNNVMRNSTSATRESVNSNR